MIDAAGAAWDAIAQIDVANESVSFGEDFSNFAKQCGAQRRDFFRYKAPTPLDPIWNPPNVYQRYIQQMIRTQQPGVSAGIRSMVDAGGIQALQILLAPSLTSAARQ